MDSGLFRVFSYISSVRLREVAGMCSECVRVSFDYGSYYTPEQKTKQLRSCLGVGPDLLGRSIGKAPIKDRRFTPYNINPRPDHYTSIFTPTTRHFILPKMIGLQVFG
ncbi:hypothetical protein [Plebeiibacterium marinum]|uniref:Uncharacterized protein n=1 Tax=Plebeiibacterium marinum TaxID=2992111 RepID=A0AAE3MHL7_9BACT|nr:hypothetical protein [Plebeiobacterium marinum]MCW3807988.1 hypothetical protein [Plebeiobacterium marinum]